MIVKNQASIKMRIHALKQEVERNFGRKVYTYADCFDLSEDIYKRTDQTLNVNTLRRFFGLVAYNNDPSITTLNIFSKYCGYESFYSIIEAETKAEAGESVDEQLVSYIKHVFEMDVLETTDSRYVNFINGIFYIVSQSTQLQKTFGYFLENNESVRKRLYTQLVNFDTLNSYFAGRLLELDAEQPNGEYHLLANCLLVKKAWLNGDHESVINYSKNLNNVSLPAATGPVVAARFFASRLYYMNAAGLPNAQLKEEISNYYQLALQHKEVPLHEHSFEIIILQAFVLTGNYVDALLFIASLRMKLGGQQSSVQHQKVFKLLTLLEAFAYFKQGKVKKAQAMIKGISIDSLTIRGKKFYSMVFYKISGFKEQTHAETDPCAQLALETGYKRILSL